MGESSYNYVRWDLVCEIMNHFVIENATAQFDEATENWNEYLLLLREEEEQGNIND